MKLKIGEKIKALRRERDMTQEELAEQLGITYQSVSRWETCTCYPDLELLPVIAGIFGVTMDHLMGLDTEAEQKAVAIYLEQFQQAISEGRIDDCIAIAREGIREYPNNYSLLNKLMYALFVAGDETGNIPDWQENIQKYDDEIVSLGERIMKYCPDQSIRLEATARLAFHHCELGRKAHGRAIFESLPPMSLCRENFQWWSLEEEEKLPFVRKRIEDAYSALDAGLFNLCYGDLLPDEEVVKVFEKKFALKKLIYDEHWESAFFYNAQNYARLARVYARLGREEDCIAALQKAAEAAKAFDNRPEEGRISNLLLGQQTFRRCDFHTADSRPVCRILKDTWMAEQDFDVIRNTTAFQKIQKFL